VRDQGQPFRGLIQFAPAADIPLSGCEEIDWPLEFMGPVFLPGDFALPCIDFHDGARRDHGIKEQVELADDTPSILLGERFILCREQRGLIGRLIINWCIQAETLSLEFLYAFGQQYG